MTLGPVFRAELLTTARRKRYYAVRFAYGLTLLLMISGQFAGWNERYPNGADELGRLTEFTTQLFRVFAATQGVVVMLLTPALIAGVIAEEKQRKTLHYLLASQLSGAEIVLSKLAARLLHVLVLLALGVPVFSLLSLYGGVDPAYVGLLYAGTIALIVFEAGISILASVVASRPRGAVLSVYLLLLAWLFVPLFFEQTIRHVEWPIWFFWLNPLLKLMLWTNPVYVWNAMHQHQFFDPNTYGFASPWATPGLAQTNATNAWVVMALQEAKTHLIAASVFLSVIGLTAAGLAVVLLRPMFRVDSGGRPPRTKPRFVKPESTLAKPVRLRTPRERAGCGDRPMLWKEKVGWRTRGPLRHAIRLAWLAFAVLVGCVIFDMARTVVFGGLGGSTGRREFHDAIRFFTSIIFPLWVMGIAGGAAGGITGEREQDTWITLTSTTVNGREILMAKAFGAVWGMRWPACAMLAFWVAGVVLRALHPAGLVAGVLLAGASGFFAAALGTFVSLRASTSLRATAQTFALLLLFAVAMPTIFAFGFAFQLGLHVPWITSPAMYLSVPAMMDAAMAAPADLLTGSPRFSDLARPRLLSGPGLALFAVTLAYLALPAWLLLSRAIASFDRVVDRPRRPGPSVAPRPIGAPT